MWRFRSPIDVPLTLTAGITEWEVKLNASAETPDDSTPLSRTMRSGTVPTGMFG
jgi:hypothetical protein